MTLKRGKAAWRFWGVVRGRASEEIALGPELEEPPPKTADYIGLEQQQHWTPWILSQTWTRYCKQAPVLLLVQCYFRFDPSFQTFLLKSRSFSITIAEMFHGSGLLHLDKNKQSNKHNETLLSLVLRSVKLAKKWDSHRYTVCPVILIMVVLPLGPKESWCCTCVFSLAGTAVPH